MRFLRGLGRFWYDFLVGDDWKIAASVVTVVVAGAALVAAGATGPWVAPAVAVAVVTGFVVVMLVDAGRDHGRR